ncbi:GNAT family N-acetyltransferase [Peristeroidobacter soli]|uniref:GNAT family N-acetyltransferase n=1 Tax=Peristeroidobacter soli TaxID=2497877 RepID=UPI00101C4BEB
MFVSSVESLHARLHSRSPIERPDYAGWRPLWDGYNAFYGRVGETALAESITAATWERFFTAQGVGRKLILAVYEAAREAGCSRVYWQTHTSNDKGRALYDKVAEHQGFIVYAHEL